VAGAFRSIPHPFLPVLYPPQKPTFIAHQDLAFSLKSVKLLFMTFSFYTYAWRFTYPNIRVREASV